MPTETETQTETLDALAHYNELRAAIDKAKAENAGLKFDYADRKGEKLARSHIAGLRKLKADIDRKRKALKADALEYGRKVDGIAKELTADVEGMIEVHERPLLELEEKERQRRERIEARLLELQLPQEIAADSATCQAMIDRVNAVDLTTGWDDYAAQARNTAEQTLNTLNLQLERLRKSEAEAAELARLRQEAADRAEQDRKAAAEKAAKEAAEKAAKEQADREEQIRRQAEEKARKEAAAAALAEADRKEAEAQAAIRAEREKAEAERRKLEAEAAKAREEAERAKREQAEAEAKAAKEKAAAEARQCAEQEAAAKRQADEAHRKQRIQQASAAIAQIAGLDVAQSLKVAQAIAAGAVPHVRMEF